MVLLSIKPQQVGIGRQRSSRTIIDYPLLNEYARSKETMNFDFFKIGLKMTRL